MTCAGGAQKRMRSCNRPSPQNGGKPCVGVCLETRSCNHRACPGKHLSISEITQLISKETILLSAI